MFHIIRGLLCIESFVMYIPPQAEDMKIFIEESMQMEKERTLRPDVYTIMEQKIEAQRDRLENSQFCNLLQYMSTSSLHLSQKIADV